MTNATDTPPEPVSAYAWLQELKAGDKVIEVTYERGGRTSHTTKVVQKITATQIVIGNKRYKRSNGEEIGGSQYHSGDIKEATPARVANAEKALERRVALVNIRAIKWETFPTDFLLRVLAMIEEETTETP